MVHIAMGQSAARMPKISAVPPIVAMHSVAAPCFARARYANNRFQPSGLRFPWPSGLCSAWLSPCAGLLPSR